MKHVIDLLIEENQKCCYGADHEKQKYSRMAQKVWKTQDIIDFLERHVDKIQDGHISEDIYNQDGNGD